MEGSETELIKRDPKRALLVAAPLVVCGIAPGMAAAERQVKSENVLALDFNDWLALREGNATLIFIM